MGPAPAGLNIIKYSHTREARARPAVEARRHPLLQPVWWGGFAVFLVGNVCDFVALGLAGQSVVSICGSMSMVSNALTARLFGERFLRTDLAGIAAIIVGVVITIVFSKPAAVDMDLADVLARYRRPASIVFLLVTAGACAGLYLFIRLNQGILPEERGKGRGGAKYAAEDPGADEDSDLGGEGAEGEGAALAAGGGSGAGEGGAPGAPEGGERSKRRAKLYRLAHPAIGALIAALAINFGKAVSEMFIATSMGNNQLDKGLTWVFIAVFVFCLVSQMAFIDKSLRINDAMLHVPFFYVLWNIMSMLGGGIVFGEFDGFTGREYAAFVCGAAVLFAGVYVVSLRVDSGEPRAPDPPLSKELLAVRVPSDAAVVAAPSPSSPDPALEIEATLSS